jgi:hypothetical protein
MPTEKKGAGTGQQTKPALYKKVVASGGKAIKVAAGRQGKAGEVLAKLVSTRRTRLRVNAATMAENVTRQVLVIQHGEHRFRLRRPIDIEVSRREGMYWHELTDLGIVAAEKDKMESLAAFALEFSSCWFTIASEDDSALTKDARQLKKKLLSLVETVERAR